MSTTENDFAIIHFISPDVDTKKLGAVIKSGFGVNVTTSKFTEMMAIIFEQDVGHLRHLHYGFILIADVYLVFDFLNSSELHVHTKQSRDRCVAIISGTLKQWRETIVCCMQEHISDDTRTLANAFLREFDRLGESAAFSDYRRNAGLILQRKN